MRHALTLEDCIRAELQIANDGMLLVIYVAVPSVETAGTFSLQES